MKQMWTLRGSLKREKKKYRKRERKTEKGVKEQHGWSFESAWPSVMDGGSPAGADPTLAPSELGALRQKSDDHGLGGIRTERVQGDGMRLLDRY